MSDKENDKVLMKAPGGKAYLIDKRSSKFMEKQKGWKVDVEGKSKAPAGQPANPEVNKPAA